MKSFDEILDLIMQMDFESREMLVEILIKRQIEERRKEISKNGEDALEAFHSGQLKETDAQYFIKKFNLLDE
jgi:hypothetical protein